VRGICCLIPGVPGQSENIFITSIVDRFLEHARIYLFHNNGSNDLYLASADWMKRNLSRRVEVAFPIYDPDIRRELMYVLNLQLADNQKARIIDATQQNEYTRREHGSAVRAQIGTYHLFERQVRTRAADGDGTGNGALLASGLRETAGSEQP
jgi:polyphosphate kinase